MDVISPEPDADPYASLRALANGWRFHAYDLLKQHDEQSHRAWILSRVPLRDRSVRDPDPEQLQRNAWRDKITAATLMKAARDLDTAIERAVDRAVDRAGASS